MRAAAVPTVRQLGGEAAGWAQDGDHMFLPAGSCAPAFAANCIAGLHMKLTQTPARSICRSALFGVGSTLRKLGRYALALEKYERLCKLNSHLKIVGYKPNWCACSTHYNAGAVGHAPA